MRSSRILSAGSAGRALGEIAIIVAGVLIALGADAWWTAREEAEQARSYMERFAEDIAADRAAFEAAGARDEGRVVAADELLSRMEVSDAPPRDSATVWLSSAFGGTIRGVRTGTWVDATSGGRLALLRDSDLRDALLRYYEELGAFAGTIVRAQESMVTFQVLPVLTRQVDSRATFGSMRADPDARVFVRGWEAFRTDPELRGLLRLVSASSADRVAAWDFMVLVAECTLLALRDAGTSVALAPDRIDPLRERCATVEF